MEAREGYGVTMRKLSETLPFTHVPTGGTWTEAVDGYVDSKIGQVRYGWLDILRRIFGFKLNSNRADICSELAANILRKCGLNLTIDATWDPGTLKRETLSITNGHSTFVKADTV